jgi:hypothetical protein
MAALLSMAQGGGMGQMAALLNMMVRRAGRGAELAQAGLAVCTISQLNMRVRGAGRCLRLLTHQVHESA